jgi:hypothetical protein
MSKRMFHVNGKRRCLTAAYDKKKNEEAREIADDKK